MLTFYNEKKKVVHNNDDADFNNPLRGKASQELLVFNKPYFCLLKASITLVANSRT